MYERISESNPFSADAMSTNQPVGWEVLDMRYGSLIARLQSTQDRIINYLEGGEPKD